MVDWSEITGKPDYMLPHNTPLRKWYAALANRHYSPAKIAVIGDSLSEGVGASQFGRGWVPKMTELLRARFPSAGSSLGGAGFVASWDNPGYGGGAPSYTYPVIQNSGYYSEQTGFSLKSNTLLTPGDKLTYTFTGTSIHVWYLKQYGGGNFSVMIDGTIVAASVVTAASVSGVVVWTSAALTPGNHTIQVTRLATGGSYSVIINGFRVFNGDELKGIQIFNGSQSGLTSANFVEGAEDWDRWARWLGVIKPQLVILELGLNDWASDTPMASFKMNLKLLISTIRTQATTDPSIVVFAATEANSGSYASTYTQLHQVWEQVVAEDTKTALFDASSRFISPNVDNSDGYYYDMMHPSDKGHAAIADRMVSFLSPL